jgi:hypothetical protein
MNYKSTGGCLNYEVSDDWEENEGCKCTRVCCGAFADRDYIGLNFRRGGGCLLRG